MTPSNLDLENLHLVLSDAARQTRALRKKKPTDRTVAELVAIARLLRPALKGLDKFTSQPPAVPPTTPKKNRRKK